MVTLIPFMPFDRDPYQPNLGRAYNEALALLPDGAWGVLLDHDAMHTTKGWWWELQAAIATKPDAGAFTACTNRIAAQWQQAGDKLCHDMEQHYKVGELRAREHRTLLDITDTKGFGGVLICVSKAAWQQVGGFADGLLCVDHSLHFRLRDAGYRNYLIESLFMYHRRRAFGGELPRNTPIAKNCPCRGNEPMPTVRIPMVQV